MGPALSRFWKTTPRPYDPLLAAVEAQRFPSTSVPPRVGEPWEQGDSYPHSGTLSNNEAVGTSPGPNDGPRYDPRDYRVERVFIAPRVGVFGRSVWDDALMRHVAIEVQIPVISKAKAEDVCRHAEAASGSATSPERVKLTRERGPWFDRAVGN